MSVDSMNDDQQDGSMLLIGADTTGKVVRCVMCGGKGDHDKDCFHATL